MSKTLITIERVNEVKPHPNADRLEIIQVLGFQVVTGKGNFSVGDSAVYFPPDILLPSVVADRLGVSNYLKHSDFPGEGKIACRVGACRLRGIPSYGFVVPFAEASDAGSYPFANEYQDFGNNVTEAFGALKYIPPERIGCGEAEREVGTFPEYTSIENIQRYPGLFQEDEWVIITEKIHGTNVRMGLCRDYSGELVFMAGSHKVRRKEGEGLYWKFMDENMRNFLSTISDKNGCCDVVVYGEIFGPGVQDMHYGQTEKKLRVFDITVNGEYIDHVHIANWCHAQGIETVPMLYRGPYYEGLIDEYTYGDNTIGWREGFKGREGVVVRPLEERFSSELGGRLVLKSVSADYRNRKGAKDLA